MNGRGRADLAASVPQRLLNLSRAKLVDFNVMRVRLEVDGRRHWVPSPWAKKKRNKRKKRENAARRARRPNRNHAKAESQ